MVKGEYARLYDIYIGLPIHIQHKAVIAFRDSSAGNATQCLQDALEKAGAFSSSADLAAAEYEEAIAGQEMLDVGTS